MSTYHLRIASTPKGELADWANAAPFTVEAADEQAAHAAALASVGRPAPGTYLGVRFDFEKMGLLR